MYWRREGVLFTTHDARHYSVFGSSHMEFEVFVPLVKERHHKQQVYERKTIVLFVDIIEGLECDVAIGASYLNFHHHTVIREVKKPTNKRTNCVEEPESYPAYIQCDT